ncbi:hypothetical protein [Streptomyces sioyaensis]|uniref:hypothetical protein n=1 Tax=Streptomyces sioyaensis TaxID=67364 RepID=UPI0037B0E47D
MVSSATTSYAHGALRAVTLLVDAALGLLVAPLSDGHRGRAATAFQALLDRFEPTWRAPQ